MGLAPMYIAFAERRLSYLATRPYIKIPRILIGLDPYGYRAAALFYLTLILFSIPLKFLLLPSFRKAKAQVEKRFISWSTKLPKEAKVAKKFISSA